MDRCSAGCGSRVAAACCARTAYDVRLASNHEPLGDDMAPAPPPVEGLQPLGPETITELPNGATPEGEWITDGQYLSGGMNEYAYGADNGYGYAPARGSGTWNSKRCT